MNTGTPNNSRLRLAATLAMLLAAFASTAQEPADDELLPAVDTSAMQPDVESDAAANVSSAPRPVVDEPELATDVTRSTTGSRVMDRIELGRTEITGNQELPKVLYIVPWQKSDPGDLMGKPVNSLLDEVLAPIDREEFIRQVRYYDDIYGDDEKK